MRILVISNLFPPIVSGGYERECGGAVEHLRARHQVLVLTSAERRREVGPEAGVRRVLPRLPVSALGSIRAPAATLRAARLTGAAIEDFQPELIYFWNGFGLPVSALVAAGRSRVPLALRICEHWFGHVFETDQFARELRPGSRGPLRGLWAAGMRALDHHRLLGLASVEPFAAGISWNSDFLRRNTSIPTAIEPVLEERIYPALPQGDRFAGVERRPAERPTIVFVGRVSAAKGIHVALDALARLRNEHRIDARLVVAGPTDSATARDVGAQLAALELEPHVELRGELEDAALATVFATAHGVLVPSVWDEPAGLVCVEAALARVPLIAARSGGIPELLREPEEALLFDRGDATAAARQLASTFERPAEAEARVERAFVRGQELSFGPYAEATDRFLGRTMAAFEAEAGSAFSSG